MREADPGSLPPRRRAATVVESVEDVRASIAGDRAAREADPAGLPPKRRAATVVESAEEIRASIEKSAPLIEIIEDDAKPFRPALRPPVAILTVLDDGEESGEMLRIRNASFVIGRVEGDLVLPHDAEISGRHAQIERRLQDGAYRWVLKDLRSTNGTFARVASTPLRPGQEFLVGARRFRFEAAGAATERMVVGAPATRSWGTPAPEEAAPAPSASLVELTARGEGARHALLAAEIWLGRDPGRCSIAVDDPMISPRHLRLARDDRGQWSATDAKSMNGLWIRIGEVVLDRGGRFQCGEQRFLLKVL